MKKIQSKAADGITIQMTGYMFVPDEVVSLLPFLENDETEPGCVVLNFIADGELVALGLTPTLLSRLSQLITDHMENNQIKGESHEDTKVS